MHMLIEIVVLVTALLLVAVIVYALQRGKQRKRSRFNQLLVKEFTRVR